MYLFIHNIIAPYRTPLFDELSMRHEIIVLYLKRRELRRRWQQDEKSLGHPSIFLKGAEIFGFYVHFHIVSIIFRERPKAVIVLDEDKNLLNLFLLLFFKPFLRFKIITWTGLYKDRDIFVLGRLLRIVRAVLYRFVDLAWCYSLGSSSYIATYLPSSRIFTGLQGYPYELLNYDRYYRPSTKFNDKRLVFVGYGTKRKGLDYFIEAFRKFNKSRGGKYTLDIVGDCSLLVDSIDFSGPDIVLHGHLDGPDKCRVMDHAMFHILPSYEDPWGWVVNEASFLSTPSAVSDRVMAKEMVNPLFIFQPNRESLYAIFEQISALSFDQYCELCQECSKESESHSLSKPIAAFSRINNVINLCK